MSDPVTNIEIEDVVSSIRRLVIDGDKVQANVLVLNQIDVAPTQEVPKTTAEVCQTKLDKFVLTPELMVMAEVEASGAITDAEKGVCDEDAVLVEENCQEQEENEVEMAGAVVGVVDKIVKSINVQVLTMDSIDVEATELKDMECDDGPQLVGVLLKEIAKPSVNEAREAGLAAISPHVEIAEVKVLADSFANSGQTLDRSQLIASIAELEAAITNDVHDFEPNSNEAKDAALSDTAAWLEPAVRTFEDVLDTKKTALTICENETKLDIPVSFEHYSSVVSVIEEPKLSSKEQIKHDNVGGNDDDCYDDDDLDGLLDIGNMSLDEDALRSVISEAVREELEGPLGKRITYNLRKLVRREIYRILSNKEFD